MEKYNHKKIEEKWQKYWEKHLELYRADDESQAEKQYILDMFPYPSGDGLHVGHVESYTATDIISRYLRMKGFNVLHPQGWDAFGLPAENYAIKTKIHPAVTTKKAIINFKKQMKMMGFSYDWSREVNSSDSDYYKYTQWFFLLLYKNGLVYKKKGKVNWCNSCQTVLANEQAENGICERCKNPVTQKDLEQWYFKITDFIEDNKQTSGLISGLDKVDWPESTKIAQKNWIGKSQGTIIKFSIFNFQFSNKSKNSNVQKYIEVFTTRVDTIFGCTYCVVAPEHELITNCKSQILNYKEVKKYVEQAKKKTDLQRMETKEKTGVKLEGVEAINPFNNEAVPIFVADYVLGHYGTGAVMAVPGHDERDFEFAKKYKLPIKAVIAPYLKDNPRQDKNTEKRNVVTAIVKNPKNNTFLCLNWKTTEWKSFPAGGIDGDDLIIAAKREIKEETGYKNIKFIRQIGDSVYAEFYRPHKDSNVYAHFKYLLFELENEEIIEVSQKEKNQHEAIWIEENKIDSFINVWNQKLAWGIYKQGDFTYCEDGILINSDEYNGLTSEQAREKMTEWLEKNKLGKKKINYKIRDWLVSRQRYWGVPIPIIYCDKCGEMPAPEKDLPVELPTDVDFMPTGKSPLIKSKKFQDVKCPNCGGQARREADTMDTFVCSSWYYLRYADPKNKKEFAGKEMIKKWLPVDLYVGGAEHTVLHLLYARFFTKVLRKLGYIDFDEPFTKLRHQGIILAEDGRKMSKSLGNVVNPDDVVQQYGADALRLFEMFMGPLEDAKPWNTKGIIGMVRFLERVWKLRLAVIKGDNKKEVLILLVATNNEGKLKELKEHLKSFKILSLKDIKKKLKEPEENGKTFAENSLLKAKYYAEKTGYMTVTDDSGLCVNVLGGRPGVFSSRYAGGNYIEAQKKIINELAVADDRSACFKSVITLYDPKAKFYQQFEGICEGQIVSKPSGSEGFGYDPIFKPKGLDKTFGQCSYEEKFKFDHRKKAADKLIDYFNKKYEVYITSHNATSLIHKTIKKVSEDIEALKFNTAISALMILVNEMEKQKELLITDYQLLITLLSPFAPHLAEELWQKLDNKDSVFKQKWPEYDVELVKDNIINLVVQVNGKLRDTIEAPVKINEAEAKKIALNSDKIRKWIHDKEVIKIIFVKGRVVNIVVN